jgi:hypothetical protein
MGRAPHRPGYDLPVISQQLEPVREIDKQAVEKAIQSRERLYSRHTFDRQIRPIRARSNQR